MLLPGIDITSCDCVDCHSYVQLTALSLRSVMRNINLVSFNLLVFAISECSKSLDF